MAGLGAATPDRLSGLPDDLLIHILSFAPSREAASTTALSRRWRRPLWLETGVVNFDHRSYTTTTTNKGAFQSSGARVWDDSGRAHKLYRSRGRDARKWTLVFMCDDTTYGNDDLPDEDEEEDADAVQGEEEDVTEVEKECTGADERKRFPDIEELRVERLDCGSPGHRRHIIGSSTPFAALRVLEITGYLLQPDAQWPLAFPFLEAMRLRRCSTEIATLQDMISAAPRLADIYLEAVCFDDDQYEYHLRCPAATVIVIVDLHAFSSNLGHFRAFHLELDAPRLCRFRYAHVVTFEETYISFKRRPMSPDLEKVHLEVHSGLIQAGQVRHSLLISVRHVRFLKLTAYSLADLDDAMEHCFYNLERLEIEELCGWSVQNHGDMTSALVKLLRRCPGMRELRLKFSWREYLEKTTNPADLNAAMSDFMLCKALVNAGDDEKQIECCCDSLDHLHKICCGCKMDCLQSSLRRVVVEFDAEELTCFQVRLVKFLAKNAVALEEIIVDGPRGYDSSHIDRKIARWLRKRKKLAASRLLPVTSTPRPQWPPPLSEFPLLGGAPDPAGPIPASPCSQDPSTSTSIGRRWRPVRLVDLYGEFASRHRCSPPLPRRFPPRRRPPPATSHRRSAAHPGHPCMSRVNR